MILEHGNEETYTARAYSTHAESVGGTSVLGLLFFQLPFPEMKNSNRTKKTQASVHIFILDDY